MREIPVEEAVGTVLGHDLTQVVPGGFKGVRFRRGHRIAEADIDTLKSMGKEHVFVLEVPPGMVHEEDAAVSVSEAVAGEGVERDRPAEGKVNLRAAHDGLLTLAPEAIARVNRTREIAVVTRRDRRPVHQGQKVGSVKVIPLLCSAKSVETAVAEGTLLSVRPFRRARVWLLTTGQEVYSGKVTDAFRPAVERKLAPFGATLAGQTILPDDGDVIAGAVRERLESGEVDLLLLSGGMSVDPDDRTPAAVRRAGVEVISQGAPVLPGSMFLLGRHGDVPVLGLPACVIHDPVTIFDVMLPRVLAGEVPTADDIAGMGVGGLLEAEGGLAWDL